VCCCYPSRTLLSLLETGCSSCSSSLTHACTRLVWHRGEHRYCISGRRYLPQKSTNLTCSTRAVKYTPVTMATASSTLTQLSLISGAVVCRTPVTLGTINKQNSNALLYYFTRSVQSWIVWRWVDSRPTSRLVACASVNNAFRSILLYCYSQTCVSNSRPVNDRATDYQPRRIESTITDDIHGI